MGNTEIDLCQKNYMCNIFSIKNKNKRKSISLNIKNNKNNINSLSSNELFINQDHIENGEQIINSNNINQINLSYFRARNQKNSKFFLLNPYSRNSEILKKTISKNIKNKSTNFTRNGTLDIINTTKLSHLMDSKHNLKKKFFEKCINNNINDDNSNKNIEKNSQNKINKPTEEEDTIINSTLSQKSLHSIQSCPLRNNKDINNIMNINNISEIKEMKESEENKELSDKENEIISEKQIELFEKSIKTDRYSQDSQLKKLKNAKNLIKGLKGSNFKYSEKSLIKARFSKNFTINESQRRKIREINKNINEKFKGKISSKSIPEVRHLEPEHPLNFLLIKREIKSSLFPLNKKSFNIITYKEDNSKQYSYFDNGIANGITKYIISNKKNIIFEGEFENGFPKGYGKYSIVNEGRFYEGIWDKEILIGIETWKDGTIYMGNFENNKKNGVGMYRWPDGTIYYGEWKNDNMEGYCQILYADDRRYEGQILNNVKNGYGEFTWKKTRKYFGNYVNDLKDGFGIYVFDIKSFQIYIGFWHKGKMEGIGAMICGDKIYYGKWSKGEKIENYISRKDLKIKYKSNKLKTGSNLINHRSMINIQNSKIKLDLNNKNSKKDYHNKTKIELEKCIDFLCKDFKILKNYIINLFIKSNRILIKG